MSSTAVTTYGQQDTYEANVEGRQTSPGNLHFTSGCYRSSRSDDAHGQVVEPTPTVYYENTNNPMWQPPSDLPDLDYDTSDSPGPLKPQIKPEDIPLESIETDDDTVSDSGNTTTGNESTITPEDAEPDSCLPSRAGPLSESPKVWWEEYCSDVDSTAVEDRTKVEIRDQSGWTIDPAEGNRIWREATDRPFTLKELADLVDSDSDAP